ncbi:MAG: shikimate dehydrogenase [Thiogranum sp.]|nr:shikimate dehydrogenase [Thiogranum sp.]
MTEADRYAVMGNPVAHSRSPEIHRLFAEQTGQIIDYRAILVETGRFPEAVADFFSAGGKGLNVTVPFKQEAWRLADRLSDGALRAGAVNTLALTDGALYGDNTDGIGLVRDLTRNLEIGLGGRQILVLGAGGAARGVLAPLLEHRPKLLVIANRTADRARELAEQFADLGDIQGSGFEALKDLSFDLVINATSASLSGQVPQLPPGVIKSGSCCYDMVYAAEPTAFMRYALAQGAHQAFDGLGMLVEQAAASFQLWRGIMPQTRPVIRALRDQ